MASSALSGHKLASAANSNLCSFFCINTLQSAYNVIDKLTFILMTESDLFLISHFEFKNYNLKRIHHKSKVKDCPQRNTVEEVKFVVFVPAYGRNGFPVLEFGETTGVVQSFHEYFRQFLLFLSALVLCFSKVTFAKLTLQTLKLFL